MDSHSKTLKTADALEKGDYSLLCTKNIGGQMFLRLASELESTHLEDVSSDESSFNESSSGDSDSSDSDSNEGLSIEGDSNEGDPDERGFDEGDSDDGDSDESSSSDDTDSEETDTNESDSDSDDDNDTKFTVSLLNENGEEMEEVSYKNTVSRSPGDPVPDILRCLPASFEFIPKPVIKNPPFPLPTTTAPVPIETLNNHIKLLPRVATSSQGQSSAPPHGGTLIIKTTMPLSQLNLKSLLYSAGSLSNFVPKSQSQGITKTPETFIVSKNVSTPQTLLSSINTQAYSSSTPTVSLLSQKPITATTNFITAPISSVNKINTSLPNKVLIQGHSLSLRGSSPSIPVSVCTTSKLAQALTTPISATTASSSSNPLVHTFPPSSANVIKSVNPVLDTGQSVPNANLVGTFMASSELTNVQSKTLSNERLGQLVSLVVPNCSNSLQFISPVFMSNTGSNTSSTNTVMKNPIVHTGLGPSNLITNIKQEPIESTEINNVTSTALPLTSPVSTSLVAPMNNVVMVQNTLQSTTDPTTTLDKLITCVKNIGPNPSDPTVVPTSLVPPTTTAAASTPTTTATLSVSVSSPSNVVVLPDSSSSSSPGSFLVKILPKSTPSTSATISTLSPVGGSVSSVAQANNSTICTLSTSNISNLGVNPTQTNNAKDNLKQAPVYQAVRLYNSLPTATVGNSPSNSSDSKTAGSVNDPMKTNNVKTIRLMTPSDASNIFSPTTTNSPTSVSNTDTLNQDTNVGVQNVSPVTKTSQSDSTQPAPVIILLKPLIPNSASATGTVSAIGTVSATGTVAATGSVSATGSIPATGTVSSTSSTNVHSTLSLNGDVLTLKVKQEQTSPDKDETVQFLKLGTLANPDSAVKTEAVTTGANTVTTEVKTQDSNKTDKQTLLKVPANLVNDTNTEAVKLNTFSNCSNYFKVLDGSSNTTKIVKLKQSSPLNINNIGNNSNLLKLPTTVINGRHIITLPAHGQTQVSSSSVPVATLPNLAPSSASQFVTLSTNTTSQPVLTFTSQASTGTQIVKMASQTPASAQLVKMASQTPASAQLIKLANQSPTGTQFIKLNTPAPSGAQFVPLSQTTAGTQLIKLGSQATTGSQVVTLPSQTTTGNQHVKLNTPAPSGAQFVSLTTQATTGTQLVKLTSQATTGSQVVTVPSQGTQFVPLTSQATTGTQVVKMTSQVPTGTQLISMTNPVTTTPKVVTLTSPSSKSTQFVKVTGQSPTGQQVVTLTGQTPIGSQFVTLTNQTSTGPRVVELAGQPSTGQPLVTLTNQTSTGPQVVNLTGQTQARPQFATLTTQAPSGAQIVTLNSQGATNSQLVSLINQSTSSAQFVRISNQNLTGGQIVKLPNQQLGGTQLIRVPVQVPPGMKISTQSMPGSQVVRLNAVRSPTPSNVNIMPLPTSSGMQQNQMIKINTNQQAKSESNNVHGQILITKSTNLPNSSNASQQLNKNEQCAFVVTRKTVSTGVPILKKTTNSVQNVRPMQSLLQPQLFPQRVSPKSLLPQPSCQKTIETQTKIDAAEDPPMTLKIDAIFSLKGDGNKAFNWETSDSQAEGDSKGKSPQKDVKPVVSSPPPKPIVYARLNKPKGATKTSPISQKVYKLHDLSNCFNMTQRKRLLEIGRTLKPEKTISIIKKAYKARPCQIKGRLHIDELKKKKYAFLQPRVMLPQLFIPARMKSLRASRLPSETRKSLKCNANCIHKLRISCPIPLLPSSSSLSVLNGKSVSSTSNPQYMLLKVDGKNITPYFNSPGVKSYQVLKDNSNLSASISSAGSRNLILKQSDPVRNHSFRQILPAIAKKESEDQNSTKDDALDCLNLACGIIQDNTLKRKSSSLECDWRGEDQADSDWSLGLEMQYLSHRSKKKKKILPEEATI